MYLDALHQNICYRFVFSGLTQFQNINLKTPGWEPVFQIKSNQINLIPDQCIKYYLFRTHEWRN